MIRHPLRLLLPVALFAGCASGPAPAPGAGSRLPEAVRADLAAKHLRGLAPDDPAFDAAIDVLETPAEILAHIRENAWEAGQLDRFMRDRIFLIVRCTDGQVRSLHYRAGKPRNAVILTPRRERILRRLYAPGAFDAPPAPEIAAWSARAAVDPPAELERAISAASSGPLPPDDDTARRARENLAAAGARADAFGRALGALRESTPSPELCGAAVWLLSRLDRMKFRREGDKGSIPDAESFDPRTFYENTFYAVRARNLFLWGRQPSDREFLLFVLPPRMTDEPLQRWRRHFFEVLEPEVRGLTDREDAIQVAREACSDFFQYEGNTTWEDFGMLTALAVHEGRCEDCSNVDNALLRSIGIPAGQAFTPWWGHGDGNHAWTWVPGSKGFAGDGSSGVKVYVKTLDALEDVTEMHTQVTRLDVETGGADGAEAQLMVWNHEAWRRVMGVKVQAGRAVFDKVGCRRPFALLVRVADRPDLLLATEKGGGWRMLAAGTLPAGEGPVDVAFEKVSPLGEFMPEEDYTVSAWDGTAWAPVASRRLQTGALGFRAWPDRAYRVTGGKFAGRPFTVSGDPAADSPVTVR